MKLRKEICKKCLGTNWGIGDRDTWDVDHRVWCYDDRPGSEKMQCISIDRVPDHCRMKMEYLVLEQNEKETK